MGEYTILQFSAYMNPRGVSAIRALHDVARNKTGQSPWAVVAEQFPEIAAWAQVARCDFIPFGSDGDKASGMSVLSTNMLAETEIDWQVSCALKNYEGEVEQFLSQVLPMLISDPCQCTVIRPESEPETIVVHPRKEDT